MCHVPVGHVFAVGHGNQIAEAPRCHDIVQDCKKIRIAEDVANHEVALSLLRHHYELGALFGRWCHGFFEEYMIAEAHGLNSRLDVHAVLGADEGGFCKARLGEELLVRCIATVRRDAVLGSHAGTALRIGLRNRNDFGVLRCLEGIWCI
jgi:hypothetical protein